MASPPRGSTTRELPRVSATHIARELRAAARPCVVLLGAGCSRSAGIPLASEVVDYVRINHDAAYRRASQLAGSARPGYPEVMRAVPGLARTKMLLQFVKHSTLNRGHAALGYLIRTGHVGRVLTTNFDDLILRGCALHGIFPPVYDLGMLGELRDEEEHGDWFRRTLAAIEPVILHLHGRHNGAYQIHSTRQAEAQRRRLAPVIDGTRDRLWIVVGYSGESDPLWSTIAEVVRGKNPARLCWVNRAPPRGAVLRDLLRAGGMFVASDADRFFATLAATLPPRTRDLVTRTAAGLPRATAPWLAHPVAHARALATRLARSATADTTDRVSIASARAGRLERLLARRPSHARRVWREAIRILDTIDRAHALRRLAGLARKPRSLHVAGAALRAWDAMIQDLGLISSHDAVAVRTRCLLLAARALAHLQTAGARLPADVVAFQKRLAEAADDAVANDLRLALASVLLARCDDAARRGDDSPGLLQHATRTLVSIRAALPAQARRALARAVRAPEAGRRRTLLHEALALTPPA